LTANRRRNDSVLREENKGENGMNGKGEPKLIFPGLARFYASVSDLWYPMIRFAIGAILFMHGYFKVANLGIARVAANFGTNYGLPMPTFLAYAAVFLETVGAIKRRYRSVHSILRGGARHRVVDRHVRRSLGQGLLGQRGRL
jgi:DoxX